jgi:hypothetical protein
VPREFTQEGGELTPTHKSKRRFVEQKYRALIDAMYPRPSSQLATGHPPPGGWVTATVALILVALSRKKCATDVADPRAPDRLDCSDRRLTLTPLWKEQEHEHEHHSALEPGA